MLSRYLPFDVLNIILEYDGRIKYLHKNGIYINIISKNDYRYNIVKSKINNQLPLVKHFNDGNNEYKFYIDIYFKNKELGLIFCRKILYIL